MNAAAKVITVGKRLVPVGQIGFVEPFDPTANPEFKPEKEFKLSLANPHRELALASEV
jgi:hypothetical protein